MSLTGYVKLCDCKPGTKLQADGGFTCIAEDTILTVNQASDGLWVPCEEGRHYLAGQVEDGYLIGLYPTTQG